MGNTLGIERDGDFFRHGTKSTLRILMVAPQPFFRARGTPFSILHRIRALLESGHQVDLVTYPFGEDIALPGLRILRSSRTPFIDDVKIGPSIAKLILDIPLYFETKRALSKQKYDVLHSHEEAAFFSVHLARKYKIKHVYDMHSSLPQQLRNFRAYDFFLIRAVFTWLERRVLTNCSGVITICPELAQIAAKECGSIPHEMIENTADDSKVFGESKEDPRTELGLNNKQIILYTGTFESYQGLDILFGAFARLHAAKPHSHLLMVGGQPNQIDYYAEMVRSIGIANHVTFAGSVHPSRIKAFLKAADVIVSPRSSGTNTPLKIYGYMRALRPLVATDLPTHTQTLDSEVALLVHPTEEGLAKGIQRILEDPLLAQRLANSAAERSEELFSDAAYVSKVSGFYERVFARETAYGPQTPIAAQP